MKNPTPCSVDGCERVAVKRGWCEMHYMRQRLYGDVGGAAPQRYFDRQAGFWAKVNRDGPMSSLGPCWLWTGARNEQGYGRFGRMNSSLAHRTAYEWFVAPIPVGLRIDHLCHNADPSCPGGPVCQHRACVNPSHLEPVTDRENLFRSALSSTSRNAAKTHCARGHDFTEANTRHDKNGHRHCRECDRIMRRAAYYRKKAG